MAALLLKTQVDLPPERAWPSLKAAVPALAALLTAESGQLTLRCLDDDPSTRTIRMVLSQGAVVGSFELALIDAGDGSSTVVWSGDVPEPMEDELETVLALQTVFRRWARGLAQPAPLAPG